MTDDASSIPRPGDAVGRLVRAPRQRGGFHAALRSLVLSVGLPALLSTAASAQIAAATPPDAVTLDQVEASAPPASPVTARTLSEFPALQEAYERARSRLDDGQTLGAIETLEAALRNGNQPVFEPHALLALAYAEAHNWAAARGAALHADSLRPGSADANFVLGRAARVAGELNEAIQRFRAATLAAQREPNNLRVTQAWYELGDALERAGLRLAAAQAFEQFDLALWETHAEQRHVPQLADLLKTSPRGAFDRRVALLRELGRADELERTLGWGLARWPEDAAAVREYGRLLLARQRPADAFTFCTQRLAGEDYDEPLLSVAVQAGRDCGRLDAWIDAILGDVAAGRRLGLGRAVARELITGGQPASAARVLAALHGQRPGDAGLAWQLADAYRAQNDYAGALRALAAFVASRPDAADWSCAALVGWLADDAQRTGWLSAVADVLESAGEDCAARYVAALVAFAGGRTAEGEQGLRPCVTKDPVHGPALAALIEVQLARGQWEQARIAAQAALEKHPDVPELTFALAEALDGLDDQEGAEEQYRRAIRLRPGSARFNLGLARHYKRTGNLLSAQRYFQATLDADPTQNEAFESLIYTYLTDQKTALARDQFERYAQSGPSAEAVARARLMLEHADRPYRAEHLAALQARFERHPSDAQTARLLAAGLHLWGRQDEARAVISQALAVEPNDYSARILLANIQRRQGEFSQAVATLSALAERFPRRREVLEPLAQCLMDDFEVEASRDAWRRLIELEPGQTELSAPHRGLLETYLPFGEYDAALQVVDGWYARYGGAKDALDAIRVTLLAAAGRHEEAFQLAAQRLEDAPDSEFWRQRFVEIGQRSGQFNETERRIRAWMVQQPEDLALVEDLVDLLLAAGRPNDALEVVQALKIGDNPVLRLWRARCLAAQGKTDDALQELLQLLDDPNQIVQARRIARSLAIDILRRAEQTERALGLCADWLSQAGAVDPDLRGEALNYRRMLLLADGREEEYVATLEELFAMAKDDPGLNNDLGYSWVDQGVRLEEATRMIRYAVAATDDGPRNGAFLDSLGWAHYKAGDFAAAQRLLSRATRLVDGRDPVNYDHLGDAAYRAGDVEAARRAWEEGLRVVQRPSTSAASQPAPRNDAVLRRLREKLAALDAGQTPATAPTAAESAASQP